MSVDASFFGGLRVSSVEWSLSRATSHTRLHDGTVIPIERGAPLWRGVVTLADAYHRRAAEIEARLAKLTGAGQFFLAHDPRYRGPQMDRDGLILGGATPTIHTLDPDGRRLRVTGLPGGYSLSPGDWIGWTYGENPTRYALHRLVTGATASAGGLTPLFEVVPAIRPGASVGAAVALVKPQAKALVVSAEYGRGRALITDGATFEITQTLR